MSELSDYEKEQFEKSFQKEIELANEREEHWKKTGEWINHEHPDRSYFPKYRRFILDIRKPSFLWFLVWCACAVIGFVKVITWIFDLFYLILIWIK